MLKIEAIGGIAWRLHGPKVLTRPEPRPVRGLAQRSVDIHHAFHVVTEEPSDRLASRTQLGSLTDWLADPRRIAALETRQQSAHRAKKGQVEKSSEG